MGWDEIGLERETNSFDARLAGEVGVSRCVNLLGARIVSPTAFVIAAHERASIETQEVL